jgi:hypothetical protein
MTVSAACYMGSDRGTIASSTLRHATKTGLHKQAQCKAASQSPQSIALSLRALSLVATFREGLLRNFLFQTHHLQARIFIGPVEGQVELLDLCSDRFYNGYLKLTKERL